MANQVEKLKKRALEITETKSMLKEHTVINMEDLTILDELFDISFKDDSAISDAKSLLKVVNNEQNMIKTDIDKNIEDIDETSTETNNFIHGLKSNICRLEQMERTSDLVKIGTQIRDTEERIDELEEIKTILEVETSSGVSSLDSITTVAVSNIEVPSIGARVITAGISMASGLHLNPTTGEASAQLVQMGIDAGKVAMPIIGEKMVGAYPPPAIATGGIATYDENGKMIWHTALENKDTVSFGLPDTIYDDLIYYSQPYIQSPRSLISTQQGWHYKEGVEIFNTPYETGRLLDSFQGKVNGFEGTCGLVSCVNVLRMADVNISEADIVLYASTHENSQTNDYLCTIKEAPDRNGGTCYSDRKEILEHFGIESVIQDATFDNISRAVAEGKGVILSVDAGLLWRDKDYVGCLHAITATSVEKCNGNVVGFFVCDSGRHGKDAARYYTADEIERAVRGRKMNVTMSIIR